MFSAFSFISYVNSFCTRELEHLFEDCSAFNDSSYFGGRVCGSDGDTYPNWLYVRCINYNKPSPYNGKFLDIFIEISYFGE